MAQIDYSSTAVRLIEGPPLRVDDASCTRGLHTNYGAESVRGRGVAVPLHGASDLAIPTPGDLCVRAPAAACSLSVLAALAGIAFVAWTVVVAHNGNTRGIQLTAIVTAATAPALILTVAFAYARRSGWGFAMTASRPTLAQDPGRPSSGRGDAERVLPGRIDPVTARTGDADA